MKLEFLKTKNKRVETFDKKEWAKADKEHYGKRLNWQPKKYTLVAKEHGEICGTARFHTQSGVLYVSQIIVAENRRQSGIGGLLMKKIEGVAKKKRAHKIYFHTGKNWGAAKFYRKLGYRKTAELRRHYGKVDFVIFTKFL